MRKIFIGTFSGGWGNGPYPKKYIAGDVAPVDQVIKIASDHRESDTILSWREASPDEASFTPAKGSYWANNPESYKSGEAFFTPNEFGVLCCIN